MELKKAVFQMNSHNQAASVNHSSCRDILSQGARGAAALGPALGRVPTAHDAAFPKRGGGRRTMAGSS